LPLPGGWKTQKQLPWTAARNHLDGVDVLTATFWALFPLGVQMLSASGGFAPLLPHQLAGAWPQTAVIDSCSALLWPLSDPPWKNSYGRPCFDLPSVFL